MSEAPESMPRTSAPESSEIPYTAPANAEESARKQPQPRQSSGGAPNAIHAMSSETRAFTASETRNESGGIAANTAYTPPSAAAAAKRVRRSALPRSRAHESKSR